MSDKHETPHDTSCDLEQMVDAMEEDVFGTTMGQERDHAVPDPDRADPEDGTTAPPTTTEFPA